jgi:lipoprotein signal peptidase
MTQPTHALTEPPAADGEDAVTDTRPRRNLLVLGLLAAVVVVDQTTKWWAWRHAPEAIINPGGTWLIGRPVSGWFSGPVTGAILDLLSGGLLSLAGHLLVRRRRRGVVHVAGALMIGGWSSNLLDRLGLHGATAPGSVRGAIDFIPVGPPYWNLADFAIIGAAALFLAAACARGSRSPRGAAPTGDTTPVTCRRPRARRAAAGLGLAVVVGAAAVHGAVYDDGVVTSPRTSADSAGHG